ncbi:MULTISPECIES: gluconeogenesis factor YvcK family protein [unclassified Synechocystis]|uniref:gluconeogenesis factor YvcK family protein n=1 Tax=unclassified Synechocystis TaxID=2640012 RepID=UPI00048D3B22|nr:MULTISPECIES: gluconeogenesis factor YvcK family protein [unclassified Synechocystis]MCT0254248.1 YvcK family protein [Synechocystis sp. CS-94]
MSHSRFKSAKSAMRKFKTEQRKLGNRVSQRTPPRVNRWFKWMAPGLFVKRWMVISAVGLTLIFLGLAIWVKLTPIFRITEFVSDTLGFLTNLLPNYVSGPLILALGLFFVFWGQSRTVGYISEVLQPDNDQELVDVLLAHRRLNKGAKIVVVGGGTGLSTLLRGLKHYSANITAIVTVADDGGSSGRLRREMGMLPPGDIRNCIAALADEEKLLTELFQYRFRAGDGLSGHSFGNLFITAMAEITGDLEMAAIACSKVLAVRGKVLPATLEDVKLWAEMEDGRYVEGESNIPEAQGRIRRIGCLPESPRALPAVLKAIRAADYIIIGPGSLYTSILPNLLIPEIQTAIAKAQVPRIYICNVMTQPGETDNYTVSDHLTAIDQVSPEKLYDAVLVQRNPPSAPVLEKYAAENSHPVYLDREAVIQKGCRIVLANVMQEDEKSHQVRHDPQRLARVLMRWYGGQ